MLKCFKRRRVQDLTDANCAARMKRAKLLLQNFPQSSTDFVFFKDKKMSSVASSNNQQNDRCTQNAICLHFLPHMLNICRKFEFLIFQGSVATCLRWGGSCCMGFVTNFIRFPAVQTFWTSVKIWQSYRRLQGGNLLRHSVVFASSDLEPGGVPEDSLSTKTFFPISMTLDM